MTLEERKNNIIESLKLLKEDCAWYNEQENIASSISLLEGVIIRSDIYPDDHISVLWKQKHDKKLEKLRSEIENG